MKSFIIVIPPWDILVARFGLSEDMDLAIASEDTKLTYAWSDKEDKNQLTPKRELTIYPPVDPTSRYYYQANSDGTDMSLPQSFVEFCVQYREQPLYGVSKSLGGL